MVQNKQVAAMLGLLTVASIVVIFVATKKSNYTVVRDPLEEPDDVSDKAHIFSTHT